MGLEKNRRAFFVVPDLQGENEEKKGQGTGILQKLGKTGKCTTGGLGGKNNLSVLQGAEQKPGSVPSGPGRRHRLCLVQSSRLRMTETSGQRI